MPIPHRERGARLSVLLGLVAGVWQPIWAQEVQTTRIQPTFGMLATASTNSNLTRNIDGRGKKELILMATPGLEVYSKGWLSEVNFQGQVNVVRYVRGTQADKALPSGLGRLRLDLEKDTIGLISTVQAQQVQADYTARPADPASTANAYTDTTVHAAPYVRKQLDADTSLDARLDRGLLHSSGKASSNAQLAATSSRRDAFMTNDSATLLGKPTPLGYRLEARHRQERYKGDPDPTLDQKEVRATALLTPDPDLQLGVSAVHSDEQLGSQKVKGNDLGLEAEWRPTQRSRLYGSAINHPYGREWHLDVQHRWPQVSVGMNAERSVTTYARDANRTNTDPNAPTAVGTAGGSGGAGTSGSTGGAKDQTGSAASTASAIGLQPYETVAQLREVIRGRLVLMGIRNQLSIVAGRTKSSPIVSVPGSSLLTGPQSIEYVLDAGLTHRLSPSTDLLGSLHWSRVWTANAVTGTSLLSRDFSARTSIDTKLTPFTTATVGVKREIYHSNPDSSTGDTSGYVGFNHRF